MDLFIDVDLLLGSMNQNVAGLKKNLAGLARLKVNGVTKPVLRRVTAGLAQVDRKLSEMNAWAHKRLRRHYKAKKEKKELEIQIGQMESEGNVPSNTAPADSDG